MIPESHRIRIPDIKIIGIHGRAGAGKDTIATQIQDMVGDTYIHSFAWFLKDACASAFGIPRDAFDDRETKELVNSYWGVSPRKIAQFLGTEMFRETIVKLIPELSGDFWIRRLVGYINGEIEAGNSGWEPYGPGDMIVIPDVRFENEAEFVRAHGHLIHVYREHVDLKEVGIQGHPSEAGIKVGENDWEIYNTGTMEQLNEEVTKFLKHHELIVSSDFNI